MIRFGSLIWGGTTLAILLGCYSVSLKASGERKAVNDLRHAIAADERGIRTLQVEFRTRARLPELARWNEQVFGLQAATAQQLIRDPVQLAGFEAPRAAPAPMPAPRYAIAEAPAPTPAAPLQTIAYAPAAQAAPMVRSSGLAAMTSLVATGTSGATLQRASLR